MGLTARLSEMRHRLVAAMTVLRSTTISAAMQAWARGDDDWLGGGGLRVSRPYAQSVWVHRGVAWIANSVMGVPMRMTRDKRGGEALVEDGELYALTQQPSSVLSGPEFWLQTASHYTLDGEVYWWYPEMVGRRPKQVVPLGKRNIRELRHKGGRGQLIGYQIKTWDGDTVVATPDEVDAIKSFNPYDGLRGLSGLTPSREAIESDEAAARYNLAMFANMGSVGDVFTTERDLTPEQAAQQLAELEKRYRGVGNARRLALTWGGLKFDRTASAHGEMEYLGGRDHNREEIAAAIGCPVEVLGGQADSNRAVSKVNQLNSWIGTIMPMGTLLAGAWERCIVRRFAAGRVYAWFDWSTVPILLELLRENVDAAHKVWSMGASLNDVGRIFNLGLPAYAWGDVGYLPATLIPADQIAEPIVALPEGVDGEPKAAGRTATIESQGGDPVDTKGLTETQRANVWRAWAPSLRALNDQWRQKLRTYFLAQRREVLAAIDAAFPAGDGKSAPVVTRDLVGSINIDLVESNGQLRAVAEPLLMAGVQTGGEQMAEELAGEWLAEHPAVIDAVKARLNKVAAVNTATYRKIQQIVIEATSSNATTAEIAEQIRSRVATHFNWCTGARAMTIAVTETAASINVGRVEGMRQNGIQRKQWISSRDAQVRDSHADADGQVVGIDELFAVGEAMLSQPGGSGPPAETINCRCTVVAVAG